MKPLQCRDCGTPLEVGARGCSQCALNLEAEQMIDRFVRRTMMVIGVTVALLAGYLFYLFR
jgi:predicted nucleic acid-binding Zn ribbon protein